jgi:4-hydroxybenzoate polyprenyltransferase
MSTAASTRPLPRVVAFAGDIKLSHSIFALPFAVLGMYLAAAWASRRPDGVEVLLIVVCMVLARTMARGVNRWADADVDARNPRTAGRAIPAGRLGRSFVLTVTLACAGLFIMAAAGFWVWRGNAWPLLLSPLVLAWVALYSFTKRFTVLCHLFLGSALAISPLAAALAIEPGFLGKVDGYLLALMVLCWVAGFDVIYALQDVEVDRRLGLHSLPAQLGVEPALWISRGLHVAAVAALAALVWCSASLHAVFATGVIACAALLILEHGLIARSPRRHLHMAFFTLNGIISVLLGVLGLIDLMRAGVWGARCCGVVVIPSERPGRVPDAGPVAVAASCKTPRPGIR